MGVFFKRFNKLNEKIYENVITVLFYYYYILLNIYE